MLSRRGRVFLKINIVSILFAVVSLISVTLAWFAYSGLADVKTEVGVKAWYIEFEKNDEVVSNDIVISLDDIYPGMEPRKEKITIKNLGDTDAKLKYKIGMARILDLESDYYEASDDSPTSYIEDVLAHNYPFHINISLDKLYIDAKEEATFEISITWPLDSGNDSLDSLWGRRAYLYEDAQKQKDPNEKEPAIEALINVTAEQAIDDLDSVDINYLLGKKINYDITTGESCVTLSNTCIETYVIDTYNKVDDLYVNLLPSIYLGNGTFTEYQEISPEWNSSYRLLSSKDILKIISLDIENSYIKIDGISDSIIGKVLTDTRADNILNKVISKNGYFSFESFPYINSDTCIWTSDSYNNLGFALDSTRLYGENKNTECRMIPVLKVLKEKIAS